MSKSAPAYVIRADVELRPGVTDDPAKYRDQFRRRVEAGQCHHTPYLGCREFAASFGPPGPGDQPVPLDQDLGLMLFDLDYEVAASSRPTGRGTPRFFPARLEQGVLHIPADLYAPWEVAHAAH